MCLAIPGEVVSTENNVATVNINGIEQEVRLDTLTEEAHEGDYVLVHTGFAIKKLTQKEAQETLDLFDQLIEVNEEMDRESEV